MIPQVAVSVAIKCMDSHQGPEQILGWVFGGATRCIELAEKKVATSPAKFKKVLRMGRSIPFKQIQKLIGKLRHVLISIPAGCYLFGPINWLMAAEPKLVYWNWCSVVWQVLQDWGQLIREAARKPIHVNKLIVGEANYKGTLGAPGKGAGDMWLPGARTMAPVF